MNRWTPSEPVWLAVVAALAVFLVCGVCGAWMLRALGEFLVYGAR